jgi:hydroxyacylglutathione hydrolase
MHPTWLDLGHGVLVRRSLAFAMNSVLLLDPDHTIVVDPGVLPSEIQDIYKVTDAEGTAAVTLAFTHGHWDHVLGRPWWPDAATLAHDRFATVVRRDAARILREAQNIAGEHGETWDRGFAPFAPDEAVSGLHFAKIGPWRLVTRDAPGHSDSQLTIHVVDHETLIAADMLSDDEPPILDGPSRPYLETLRGLEPLARGGAISTLIPGHGTIARTREAVIGRIEQDIAYLETLQAEVAKDRAAGRGLDAIRERLSPMRYPTRGISDAGLEEHLGNIGFVFAEQAGAKA